jgi:ELWxxDGT repeat protein
MILKDIYPGSTGSSPRNPTVMGGAAYGGADTSTGSLLWKTDGTPSGTVTVRSFSGTGIRTTPANPVALGNLLLFTAATDSAGRELWRSNGTASGTVMVKDIQTGSGNGISFESLLTVMGNRVYFWATENSGGDRLWRSDGTSGGTLPVWAPGSVYIYGRPPFPILTACGDNLFFTASTLATGEELWKSDGTAAGTALVKDIFPGTASSAVNILGQKFGVLYFSAIDATHGRELWRSDGTEPGTWLMEDLVPGTGSSLPTNAVATPGNFTYLVEDDNTGKPALRRLLWPGFGGRSAIQSLSDGRIRLDFTVLQTRLHSIDSSSDLSLWTPLEKRTPLLNGTLQYFPITPPGIGTRYYRARDLTLQPSLKE